MTSVLGVLGLKFKFYSWCPTFQKETFGFWLKFRKWTLGLFLKIIWNSWILYYLYLLSSPSFHVHYLSLSTLNIFSHFLKVTEFGSKRRGKNLHFVDDWALLTSLRSFGTLCLAALRKHDSYSSCSIIMCYVSSCLGLRGGSWQLNPYLSYLSLFNNMRAKIFLRMIIFIHVILISVSFIFLP